MLHVVEMYVRPVVAALTQTCRCLQRRQAQDAASRETALAADSLQNAPRPEFFSQFESSHR